MSDIGTFWDSLKYLGLGDFLAEECLWQKLLELNLLHENYDMKDLIFGGPILVKQVGMSLSNYFLNETPIARSKF